MARALVAVEPHFLVCRVSWNLVLVYRRWKPFLLMVSSEWNLIMTESPAEETSSGGWGGGNGVERAGQGTLFLPHRPRG